MCKAIIKHVPSQCEQNHCNRACLTDLLLQNIAMHMKGHSGPSCGRKGAPILFGVCIKNKGRAHAPDLHPRRTDHHHRSASSLDWLILADSMCMCFHNHHSWDHNYRNPAAIILHHEVNQCKGDNGNAMVVTGQRLLFLLVY